MPSSKEYIYRLPRIIFTIDLVTLSFFFCFHLPFPPHSVILLKPAQNSSDIDSGSTATRNETTAMDSSRLKEASCLRVRRQPLVTSKPLWIPHPSSQRKAGPTTSVSTEVVVKAEVPWPSTHTTSFPVCSLQKKAFLSQTETCLPWGLVDLLFCTVSFRRKIPMNFLTSI